MDRPTVHLLPLRDRRTRSPPVPQQTVELRTNWLAAATFAIYALIAALFAAQLLGLIDGLETGRNAGLQKLPPDVRTLFFGSLCLAASVNVCRFFPVVILRRPYVILDSEGLCKGMPLQWRRRRSIAWGGVQRIAVDDKSVTLHPVASDRDGRSVALASRMVDTARLMMALHRHRPDLLPAPHEPS